MYVAAVDVRTVLFEMLCEDGFGFQLAVWAGASPGTPRSPRKVPSTSMRNRTWRWVPRSSVAPTEERSPPDNLEGVDGSKDDPGVSRRGGHGPEPQRVS